nr:MAG TPA: hypothetical protein [Caudoviricetes sp.]
MFSIAALPVKDIPLFCALAISLSILPCSSRFL